MSKDESMISDKYHRTQHVPWSEGSTSDDKRLSSVDHFISSKESPIEIVITEKLDGSNSCLVPYAVYARSHAKPAVHPSFNLLKARHSQIKHMIDSAENLFGENCYAVHSITYGLLPDVFFLFGIRTGEQWSSFDEITNRAQELGLTTVPVLFRGYVYSEKELRELSSKLMKEPSVYGGDREGFVIRIARSFKDSEFDQALAKQVRKNHVQTDDHWMHQSIVPQKIKRS